VWREAGSGGAYVEMDPDVRPDGPRLADLAEPQSSGAWEPTVAYDATADTPYPEAGTVADVLAWVADDPFRARLALAAEQRRETGARQSVLGPLAKLTA
jgi:hypothetical protein